MRNPSGFTLALCLSLCSLAGAPSTQAADPGASEKAREQVKREAIELFRVILPDREAELAPCVFRTTWLEYAIPAYYFGSQLPADLVPSDVPAEPQEIMDPSGTMRDAFCHKADDELRLSFLVESLKRRELRNGNDPMRRVNWLEAPRHEYTFPIFDKNYRRAVIVSSNERRVWYWHPNGLFRSGIENDVGVSIYEKRNGRWRFIRYDLLAAGHG